MVFNCVVGDVVGCICVLIDDMIDIGGIIVGVVVLLYNDGVGDVIIVVIYGVFFDFVV